MTFYEKACWIQHIACGMVESVCERVDTDKEQFSDHILLGDYIDECYVLGLMIDNMPVELAEREI